MKMKCTKNLLTFGLWILAVTCPYFLEAQQINEPDTLDLGFKKVAVEDFNGSSYTIKIDELKNLPVTNLTNLLSGLVPGFFSVQTSGGTVDEAADFWIRGTRTTAEGILVLVDGQERDFSILSPYEVESITVIKDASITVLYGSRAANGMVLVNTKKGVKGKTKVEFTAQMINQKPLNLLNSLDALSYAKHYNEALKYDGRQPMYSEDYLKQYQNRNGANTEYYPDVNWLDTYFKKSNWVQRYNLGISGGGDRTRYFINGGFLKQAGMFNTDGNSSYSTNNSTSRFNLRSNLEVDVTKSTFLNVELYGWFDKQNRPGGDSYGAYNALVTTPANAFPPYYADNGNYMDQSGNIIKGIDGKITAGSSLYTNPWALLNRNGYSILNRTYGSFRTKLTQDLFFITKGLKASAVLSMDSYTTAITDRQKGFAYYRISDFNLPTAVNKTGDDGKMGNSVSDLNSFARTGLTAQLSYDKKIDDHFVSALVFYDQYENSDQTTIPSRFQTVGSWIGYNYAKKYYLDLTGTYHGAYKFAPEKRFGLFPTVTVGWAVSNERFFESAKPLVSYLKFRGSYGMPGNQRGVSEFQYMGRLNSTSSVYNFGNTMGGVGGFIEDIIANPNLTWEKAKQMNLGVNLRMFNDRLAYVFDYFTDERYDMYMVNNNITSILGTVASIQQNIGEMKSKGYEMALSWNDRLGDFGYSLGGTYSYSQNEILKTGEVDQPYPWLQTTGYSRGMNRGYVATGLFQTWDEIAASPRQTFANVAPGDIQYKDINGDGIIDVNDAIPIGYGTIPGIFYGFRLGLSYKTAGINILFQGAANVSRNMGGKVAYPFYSNGTIYEHQLDYWTPDNPNATFPKISTVTTGTNNVQNSSFWVNDSRYLRLKTVEFYYELPKRIWKNSFIDNIRLFANGYNMFVWSPYNTPLDPEDNGTSNTMPLTRNMSAGLSVRF